MCDQRTSPETSDRTDHWIDGALTNPKPGRYVGDDPEAVCECADSEVYNDDDGARCWDCRGLVQVESGAGSS